MIIVRTDAYILRNPYSRCKYVAIERYEECVFRGELLSSTFESLCREFDIEIPSYQNGMTAVAFCQWYMSLRLSWVTTRSITVGKNTHSFCELPAPRSLSLAKDYINRDLESAKYWTKYLLESKRESPDKKVRHMTALNQTVVNPVIPTAGPPRKNLAIDPETLANEARKNEETIEIKNKHFLL